MSNLCAAIFAAFFFLLSNTNIFSVPSFEGAEGFGADNPGARGKNVYIVTRLDDEDKALNSTYLMEGQFRWALAMAKENGGGYITFATSGTIVLARGAQVYSNTHIAGQTSPGGIAIDGTNAIGGYTFRIEIGAKDVVVRHLRLRGSAYKADGMQHSGENFVIDHCSISWFCDGAIDMVGAKNATVSWTHMGDAAACHDEGYHGLANMHRVNTPNHTMHHNLYSHSAERNPWITEQGQLPGNVYDFRNNVIYNYRKYDTRFHSPESKVNVMGNYFKPGPNSHGDEDGKKRAIVTGGFGASLYLHNNIHVVGHGHVGECCKSGDRYCADPLCPATSDIAALRPDNTYDEWSLAGISGFDNFGPFPGTLVGSVNKLDEPVQTPKVTTHSATQAYDVVLKNFGAFPRDNTDARLETEVRGGTAQWKTDRSPDNNTYSGTVLTDADKDGMPDSWEQGKGSDLMPNGHDLDADYDNIEVYLNERHLDLVGPIPDPVVVAIRGAGFNPGLKGEPSLILSQTAEQVRVKLNLKESGKRIDLSIYNIEGQKVVTLKRGILSAGIYNWMLRKNKYNLSQGVFFARVRINGRVYAKQFVLMN